MKTLPCRGEGGGVGETPLELGRMEGGGGVKETPLELDRMERVGWGDPTGAWQDGISVVSAPFLLL